MHAERCAKLKSFFLTETGYMGTAPISIVEGDEVFLIAGLHTPVVLRRDDSRGENSYTYVCPAYVQGIMYGEVWRERKMESELEDIVLI